MFDLSGTCLKPLLHEYATLLCSANLECLPKIGLALGMSGGGPQSPRTVGDSSNRDSDSNGSSGGGGDGRVLGARPRIIAPGRRDLARLRLELF